MDTTDLTKLLIAGRNTDGGWGYYVQKQSRLEPTCWAVLALVNARHDAPVVDSALQQWPTRNGLLLERQGGESNYAFHGLALLALFAAGLDHRDGNRTLIAGLQRVRGLALESSPINRQDNSIQGWSWIDGTFSWVEPTAWSLLALKTCATKWQAPLDRARIRDAERLLVDRSCSGGGWNYGNANMLGKQLVPYVPTTAVALLALRDRATETVVVEALQFMERQGTEERSAIALGLACRALRAYGHDTTRVRAALLEQLPITAALGNHAAMAAALYALKGDHDDSAF